MPRGVSRLDDAQLQRQLFNPLSEPSLAGWYSADNLPSLTFDGSGNVTAMRDLTGKGRNASTATGIPYSRNSWVNKNRGVITPNGTSHYFAIASPITYNSTTGITMLASVRNSGVNSGRTIAATSTVNGSFQTRLNGSPSAVEVLRSQQASLVSSASTSLTYIIAGGMGISGKTTSILNGVSTVVSTDPGFSNPLNAIFASTDVTELFDSQFLEMFIFSSALNQRQLDRFVGRMAWTGDMTSNLAASHPYRNRPPLIGE